MTTDDLTRQLEEQYEVAANELRRLKAELTGTRKLLNVVLRKAGPMHVTRSEIDIASPNFHMTAAGDSVDPAGPRGFVPVFRLQAGE